MAKKRVTEYKNFDIEELQKAVNDIADEIAENQYDTVLAYLGDKINRLNEVLAKKGFMSIHDFREIFGIAFSENMTAKMETVIALSTSCLANRRCLARMQDGDSICAFCFSAALQMFKKGVRENTIQNFKILNEVIIPAKYWPQVCNDMLRFEAFGDLYTWKQVANYFNCCKANKSTDCALWSKNPDIIADAIERGFRKPKNVQIVYSSPKVNTIADAEAIFAKYPFIDKIFTVFDGEFIKKNGVVINCGGRSCRGCKRCYKPGKGLVNEELK